MQYQFFVTGGKLFGIYDPFVVATGIAVLMLLLVAVGIALYSCNWPYFFELCKCYSGTNVSDTSSPLSSGENNPQEQQNPPKYEDIELQTISHLNRFVSIDLSDSTGPPKYQDIQLT